VGVAAVPLVQENDAVLLDGGLWHTGKDDQRAAHPAGKVLVGVHVAVIEVGSGRAGDVLVNVAFPGLHRQRPVRQRGPAVIVRGAHAQGVRHAVHAVWHEQPMRVEGVGDRGLVDQSNAYPVPLPRQEGRTGHQPAESPDLVTRSVGETELSFADDQLIGPDPPALLLCGRNGSNQVEHVEILAGRNRLEAGLGSGDQRGDGDQQQQHAGAAKLATDRHLDHL